jgi:cytochrome c2
MERRSAVVLLLALIVAPVAQADEPDLAQGEKLYTSQCKICHGSISQQTGAHAPRPAQSPLRLAMYHAQASAMSDIPVQLIKGPVTAADEAIAFTVPYGPRLRGIVGRPAGSVEGWNYSPTFLKTLKGMEWTEAALDVWLTSTQAWVPGVYMFYRQPNPEIRRMIILYLKANP